MDTTRINTTTKKYWKYNMKTSVEFELEPFPVPDIVYTKRDKFSGAEGTALPLKILDLATLEEMCTQFRRNVFLKANKGKLSDNTYSYHTQ